MIKVLRYLNPLERLGNNKYSVFFPFILTLFSYIVCEVIAYVVIGDPMAVGIYVIFVSVALIIYFAFRDGIRGGVIATVLTTAYYLYIIYTRNYSGQQMISGIETTGILSILYLIMTGVIGGLKQKIDNLIVQETLARLQAEYGKIRLESIIQQLPVGVIITDKHGVVEMTNKQLELITGLKVPLGMKLGKEIVGTSLHNHRETKPSDSPLAQALSSGKTVHDKEFSLVRTDGKKIHVLVNASLIRNRQGDVIAAASISNDITQQKEIEARKDDFVNMASHELKTPLTSMKLYLEALTGRMKETQDEKIVKILSSIKNQTDRLQELVNNLLDVSRLQTGKLSFTKDEFDISGLIEETLDGIPQSANKHIVYTQKTKISVFADRFRIYQVLTNLITNAIKYSPEGSKIIISAKKNQGKVVVSVQDSGIGISKDQQKKIFERLYQVTEDKEKTFPGLGMGLYISKEIIRRHKGSIWVESEKGRGSTFYFSLPLEK